MSQSGTVSDSGLEPRFGNSQDAAPPPHPLDGEWFLNLDGKGFGPYTGHKLKEFVADGRVTADSQVARKGSSDWTRMADDLLLGSLFASRLPAQAQRDVSAVTAQEGATIVQVTNNLAPNPAPALLVGDAAAKSAGVALLLSILICGVGQMYNGQVGKGILGIMAQVPQAI